MITPTASAFFEARASEYPAESAAHELAAALANESLTPSRVEQIEGQYGLRENVDLLKIKLDWLLDYSRAILDGDALSAEIADRLAPLKQALGIREGEFYRHRAAEVKAILLAQLELVLEDGILDDHEELSQAVLQRAFSLGYDEYLGLTRPRYETELVEIKARLETIPAAEHPAVERQLLALRSICELAVTQPRSLGGLR